MTITYQWIVGSIVDLVGSKPATTKPYSPHSSPLAPTPGSMTSSDAIVVKCSEMQLANNAIIAARYCHPEVCTRWRVSCVIGAVKTPVREYLLSLGPCKYHTSDNRCHQIIKHWWLSCSLVEKGFVIWFQTVIVIPLFPLMCQHLENI